MNPRDRNRVGIIGAGRLGQAMARTALRAGRSVVIANSRGPATLTPVVAALGDGASAGTVDQASAAGIVVIAVPWDRVPDAVEGLAWNGQIVIDATNNFDPRDLQGRTSSEVVVGLVGGAPVVKAANTLTAACSAQIPTKLVVSVCCFSPVTTSMRSPKWSPCSATRASSSSISATSSPGAACNKSAARLPA
jgi:predicted dinucleotide-binding enzyme